MKTLLSICLLFVMVSMIQAQKIPASDSFFPVEEGRAANEGIGTISEILGRLQDTGPIKDENPVELAITWPPVEQ